MSSISILILLLLGITISGCGHEKRAPKLTREGCYEAELPYKTALSEILTRKKVCQKDSDCELRFFGYGLDYCNLGTAISKKVFTPQDEEKLHRLAEEGARACPVSAFDVGGCEALPYNKAICKKGICESSF